MSGGFGRTRKGPLITDGLRAWDLLFITSSLRHRACVMSGGSEHTCKRPLITDGLRAGDQLLQIKLLTGLRLRRLPSALPLT